MALQLLIEENLLLACQELLRMVTEASGASSSLLTVPISLVRNPVSPRLLSVYCWDDSMAL